jgi:hypothetical protein
VPSNRRQTRHPADDPLLDETNRHLLNELQADARLSLAELGRRGFVAFGQTTTSIVQSAPVPARGIDIAL